MEAIWKDSLRKQIALPLLCSFCIGMLGPLSIPIPGLAVPFGVQSLVMLIAASFLTPKQALLMGTFFLYEGAIGFPFFSYGRSGISMLLGPSGGYLLGYVFGSVVTSFLAGKSYRKSRDHFLPILAGFSIIHFFGLLHLSCLFGVKRALCYGFFPFLGVDLMKTLLGARITKKT